ncbi:hypothetical protein L288_19990 [Sphingobium quisquiliarum P25]|uniref:Uncharacterized protein n=1 Tax=Sphingobium quisquiliarum P25 TaxID=1329909 RepID=T0HJ20_9SPHN|nr:hypothetical protein [Sphingobium quisquiliarum]EQA99314.1 hypothetical protein L288_19990 [Sphingobium quisquiliarum P25]
MKNSFVPFSAFALVIGSLSTPAFAYLDGATGSMLIQAVIGGVAAAGMFGRHFISKAKNAVSTVFRKDGTRRDS